MNMDQITGIIRAILAAAGGWLVTNGYLDSATLSSAIGALLTLGTIVWSIVNNRTGKTIGAPAAK